jgi:hypothetical protein
VLTDQKCEDRVTVPESTALKFDKVFEIWKPELDTLLKSVNLKLSKSTALKFHKVFEIWKLELDTLLKFVNLKLSKLNPFFDRDVKLTSNPNSSVLPIRSAVAHASPGDPLMDLMGTTSNTRTGIVDLGRSSPKSMTWSRVWSIPLHLHCCLLILMGIVHAKSHFAFRVVLVMALRCS